MFFVVTKEQLNTYIYQTNILEKENVGVISKLINQAKYQVNKDNNVLTKEE